jgi:hypothetical protein
MKSRWLAALGLVAVVLFVALRWRGASSDPRGSLTDASSARDASPSSVAPGAVLRDASATSAAADGGFSVPVETVRDARLREQLRLALAQVFSLARDAAAGPEGAQPASPNGNLDPTYLRERIRDDFIPMAQRCFELLQARRPGFGGRMRMRFRISAHEQLGGIVEDVSIEEASRPADGGADASIADGSCSVFGDRSFETCLRESMMTVAFRPPSRGGQLTVAYPLSLEPDAPDAGR